MRQFDQDIHHRRSIRLKNYDYTGRGAYFVTLCTQNGDCLFGDIVDGAVRLNDAGKVVVDEWLKTPIIRSEVRLDEWVVMPNHFHGVLVIVGDETSNREHVEGKRRFGGQRVGRPRVAPTNGLKPRSIGAIVAGFKSSVARRVNILNDTPGGRIWQRNYWERIVRDEQELNRIREYIQTNPMRWDQDGLHPARS